MHAWRPPMVEAAATPVPSPRLRLGLLLALLGVAGFLAALPYFWPMLASAAAKAHKPLGLLVAAQTAQVFVLCALAAWAGVAFAPRAGFDAPWLRALALRQP